ncbi:RNA polymerase factor sigma-32 [Desulfotalea psychrophila]|uniref:RNA polymerase factor sigma-32 n=1 Tax=Desulfotalea psychrophila TaxID=84980 RepID=A0ABS3AS65_9BACT|nr:RNA polymerase factor sigma-32 [Desulfocapsa sp.]MBN4065462.1 RNA polymerase factor sigma-32 [Desulfocapsa sp. AH-315-G09]MBN4067964.1 RNA polymerase factor sigma-32 [Desulfotalea psychrophila]MBN4071621.1 RNA polymerase factor sigma-32 [Desulfotalea psychrophila]
MTSKKKNTKKTTRKKKDAKMAVNIGHHENPLLALSDDANLPTVSNPALHRYLQEISQYELLSREETDELAIRFRENDDRDAAYRLVSANLRLVVKVAMDFQKYWMQNFMDLIQEGNVGLVQATKKFDPYRGVKFSYYAAYWIRAYILKFIMDNWRLVKIGTTQAQRKLFFSLNKEKKLLESQGFKPEVKLLAERLSVKESEVIEMSQRMDSWDVSLESPVRSDSEDEQKSFLPSNGPQIEDIVAGEEMKTKLAALLTILKEKLNEKETMILEERLLTDEPLTLQTIADRFGISRERVRQIEVNLLKKMKKYLEAEMPDIIDFFDGKRMVQKV